MRTIIGLKSGLLTIIMLFSLSSVFAQDAKEIVKKADEKWNGEKSSQGTMTMTIVRPSWERTIQFKIWTLEKDYSMTLITAPAKEKGQAFLKRKTEMWNWMPTISRMIKLPPSMMADGWMGSDYTNDDILKESSIVVDFTHEIIGSETIDGWNCWKIEMSPNEDAAVVWGKIIKWISKNEYLMMKSEYFDEDEYLVKTEFGTDVKIMDGRKITSKIEIIPADKDNQKTILIIDNIKFNVPLENSFFSQQNMKRLR
ncbi:MAG: outer membrane lipoprotein-sorting protein [Bacteroidales bacterium]|jgi:outer membrane lipoprotein-sorting protein|nr:outer membrane lipoprotein-sorting protein [Bacteroidales bacterium]